ncbi:hypothetical protein JCM10213_005487 [Rhodosporidiobolus nylandii]
MSTAASASALTGAVGDAQEPVEVLAAVARHFLSQALALLQETATSDELLSHPSKLSPGSTVGKHLRHLADHYAALFQAVEGATAASGASPTSPSHPSSSRANESPLRLSYDNRARNVAAETSHAAAVRQFEDLQERLERLVGGAKADGRGRIGAEREIRLEAVTPVKVEVGTTFARELWFASFHAVHHFALIRVIACGELGLTVPDDFGVAPSTLKHRESEASASPTKL